MREHHDFIRKRIVSRKLVMQSLYRWCLTGEDLTDIAQEFRGEAEFKKADIKYYERLIEGCVIHKQEIEQIATPIIGYPITDVDPIEQVIIRSAIYEMLFIKETDYAVVISEAVGLAKKYGAEEGYRFVNGVLDQVKEKIENE